MADITKGPDLLARLLNRIEDGTARVMPGEAQPNAHEKASKDLADLHAALRATARRSGKPAKGKLVITLDITAGAGNGDASPCEHFFSSVPTFPKMPKLSRPAWIDDESNILGAEPTRQTSFTVVNNDNETAAPKASRKVV